MKIIDAHIHFRPSPGFDSLAKACGHENSAEHLEKTFRELNIEHAVVMGNGRFGDQEYPPFLSWCCGLDSSLLHTLSVSECASLVEQNINKPGCVGVKLYPGYTREYITDPAYTPIYEVAAAYHKPVAIHTGATANAGSHLKYCHPLIVDEVAADFPQTSFVICHYGNPWLLDAAAVLDKNHNVCADLSGILDGGHHDIDAFAKENPGYMDYMRTWISYPAAFDRIMYGTDWPLVNMGEYIDFVSRLVPEKYWDDVFYNNANRIYGLGL